jgi:N-acetylglucosamine kinase-like BadF-type ATPase
VTACVFGLDGGGTSSRLRIADRDNQTLLEIQGDAINPNAVGMTLAANRVEALFRQASAVLADTTGLTTTTGLADAARPTAAANPTTPAASPTTPAILTDPGGLAGFASQCLAGCAAVAGMDRPLEKAAFEGLLRGRLGFSCPLTLVSDPEAALVGGLGKPEGIILVAGTGSIAVARLADGTRFRAGGYGHFLGDEGSAFQIGFQTIARTLRSLEGRDLPTTMLDGLLDHFGLAGPQDFVPLIYQSFNKASIARLAPLVIRYRDAGDHLALDIFQTAASELLGLVRSVHRQATGQLRSSDSRGQSRSDQQQASGQLRSNDLLLWGGLLDNDAWLVQEVGRLLTRDFPFLRPCRAAHDAAYGACLLALERLVC